MNSCEELVGYGINKATAVKMIGVYSQRIGTENGDYVIEDITYVGNETKIVTERCRHCGERIQREMVSKRNKWCELQRICDCQREKAKEKTQERKRKRQEEIKAERNSVIQNMIGKRYGDYEVEEVLGDHIIARCVECGVVKKVGTVAAANGLWTKVECSVHRRVEEKFTDEYIGKKNNMLKVTGITHDAITGRKRFVCLCDCGREYLVKPTLWERGKVKSCGCYQENRSKESDPIRRIKSIYHGMKQRCNNINDKAYGMYGGRGIKICAAWQEVDEFVRWSMENGYSNTKTIDRIDSNGNYEPSNCRWTTYYIQNRNKRPRGKKNGTSN